MRTYVINLARSTDRRAHISAELRRVGLDYEFFTAVDGSILDLGDLGILDASFGARAALLAGTVGCALSHLGVYRKIIADGYDQALVLEDDVMLPGDLQSLTEAIGQQLTGAEVALLSVDSPEPCWLSREGAIPVPGSRLLALPVDIRQPRSSGAYIITREACERMVAHAPPVRAEADAWWFYYRAGIVDQVRCVAPLPVHKSGKLVSTMGSYRLRSGIAARPAAWLLRRRVPVLNQLLGYRRQRIFRKWGRVEVVDSPFVEKPSRRGLVPPVLPG